MRTSVLLVLAACTAPTWELQPRPLDYQAPGPNVLELTGPPVVYAGEVVSWTARGEELQVGDRLQLGWGGDIGPGPCIMQQQIGGWLCMDIHSPARPLGGAIAEPDPANPGKAIAVFDVVVPDSSRSEVHLQAIKIDGLDSATTDVFTVSIVAEPDPCPAPFASITNQADVALYEGCTELDAVYLHQTSGVFDVTLPFLERVDQYIYFHQNSDLLSISMPRLTAVDGMNSGSGYVHVNGNPLLDSVELPALEMTLSQVDFSSNPAITEVSLPALSTAENLQLHDNDNLQNVSVPALQDLTGFFYFHSNDVLQTVDADQLATVGTYAYFHGNVGLQSVALGSLDTVGEYLYLSGNTALTTLTFPSITSVGDYTYFGGNTNWCPDETVDWEAITVNGVTNTGNGCM